MKLISLVIDGQQALADSAGVEFGPAQCKHTPCPSGYLGWHSWAEEKSKTHAQVRCPGCGKWAIWLPKAEASVINDQDRRDEKQMLEMIERDDLTRAKARVRDLERKSKR